MKKCIILKWLVASWKSTLTHKYKEDWFLVFSRDTARVENPYLGEDGISELEKEFILQWHDKIVIDNTHMNIKTLEKLSLFCKWNWYKVDIDDMIDLFWSLNEYLEVCLERNSKREWYKRVPDSVIYQMYLQNYELNDKKEWYVIVDLDWTICDLTHRLHYLDETPKNHDVFYDEVDKDLPIEKVIDIVRYLSEKHFIILTSGRRNQCCEKTVEWLKKYNVPYGALLMRQWWDKRPDTEVKKEIYDKCLANKNVIMALDDRPCILRLWRSLWIFTVNVWQREWEF